LRPPSYTRTNREGSPIWLVEWRTRNRVNSGARRCRNPIAPFLRREEGPAFRDGRRALPLGREAPLAAPRTRKKAAPKRPPSIPPTKRCRHIRRKSPRRPRPKGKRLIAPLNRRYCSIGARRPPISYRAASPIRKRARPRSPGRLGSSAALTAPKAPTLSVFRSRSRLGHSAPAGRGFLCVDSDGARAPRSRASSMRPELPHQPHNSGLNWPGGTGSPW
jgi:hypothetical protein